MESLLKSGDPLLVLAGAFFVIGASFDFIFSKKFKVQIRRSIKELSTKEHQLIGVYAEYLVYELLSYGNKSAFVLKSLALSALFYIVAGVLETTYYAGPGYVEAWQNIQVYLLKSLVQFSPAILIIFFAHALFDIFSAYLSVLYLNLVTVSTRLRTIILILLSDFIVTAFLWSVWFGLVLALHVKVADLEVRRMDIAIAFDDTSRAQWAENYSIFANKSLIDPRSVSGRVAYRPEKNFLPIGEYSAFHAITNLEDRQELAQQILDFAVRVNQNHVQVEFPVKREESLYFAPFSTSDIIRFTDIKLLMVSMFKHVVNPLHILVGETGYFATSAAYQSFYYSFKSHLEWPGWRDMVYFCDGNFGRMRMAELVKYDFKGCLKYTITHSDFGRYVGFVSGARFSPNYLISYTAFFWSSLALTVTFYLTFLVLALGRFASEFFSRQVANGVFNSEKVFFSPLFSIVSVVLIIAFAVKTSVRFITG